MSSRDGKTIKEARPTKPQKVRPASSAREALGRWGFGPDTPKKDRGMLRRGEPAYTAEDYQSDMDAGKVLAIRARECPRQRPERQCPTCTYGPLLEHQERTPPGLRSSWTLYAVVGNWTANGERPRRTRMFRARPICPDCRAYLYYLDRQQAFAAIGFDHGFGYIRASFALRELWAAQAVKELQDAAEALTEQAALELDGIFDEVTDQHLSAEHFDQKLESIYADGRLRSYLEGVKAADELLKREREDLVALVGELVLATAQKEPIDFTDRFELATVLSNARHCLTCLVATRCGFPAPDPKIRHMV